MGLNQIASLCFLLFHLIPLSASFPKSSPQISPQIQGSFLADKFSSQKITQYDNLTCDNWRLTVETNNAGDWGNIPLGCRSYVFEYMASDRYQSDLEAAADCSLKFARTVHIKDGKDAWVFDVDETLLSNAPNASENEFISKNFDGETSDLPSNFLPALAPSLRFYDEVEKLGFIIFILTGRNETRRIFTTENLHYVGYRNWKRLILRGPDDEDTPAIVYKSKKRKEIEEEGYRIRGNSGDQWSDLLGYAVAERSFKLSNPMYYAP